jgi:hypothetical protein
MLKFHEKRLFNKFRLEHFKGMNFFIEMSRSKIVKAVHGWMNLKAALRIA